MSETPKQNIYQRILAIMAEVDSVQKGEKQVNKQYTYVSHDAVTAKLHPQFVKHGVVVVPSVTGTKTDGNRTEAYMHVTFVNADNPSDSVSVDTFGFGIDTQDKGPGKAMSYAYKYALLKLFALETSDDPERDDIDHKPKTSRSPDWKGPLTKTNLNKALRAFRTEMDTCTDADQFSALVWSEKALFEQCEADIPGWWHGDEKIDFPGWEQIIADKETELSNMEGPSAEGNPILNWAHDFRKEIDGFDDLVKLNAHVKANAHNLDMLKDESTTGRALLVKVIENKRALLAQAPR